VGFEFDVSKMVLTTYITARAHGKRLMDLPIFLVQAFHHGAIVCNTRSGIKRPKDLEGKKVGIRGYTVTTGLWARGVLQHQYVVDLNTITWVLPGDEHVAEYRPPPNVVPIEKGTRMADLVASGELSATIGVDLASQKDSPNVRLRSVQAALHRTPPRWPDSAPDGRR
jgi:4,5-dihydroxyphthalate decarboxylase